MHMWQSRVVATAAFDLISLMKPSRGHGLHTHSDAAKEADHGLLQPKMPDP